MLKKYILSLAIYGLLSGIGVLPGYANNEIYWWQMREYPELAKDFDIEVKESPQLQENYSQMLEGNDIYPWQMREYPNIQENFEEMKAPPKTSRLEDNYQKTKEENSIYSWQMEEYKNIQANFPAKDIDLAK